MKFENTRVYNFKHALRGMRNPKESWDKSDSYFGFADLSWEENNIEDVALSWAISQYEKDLKNGMDEEEAADKRDESLEYYYDWLSQNGVLEIDNEIAELAYIGPNDMDLAQRLIRGGSEHRKFMRQIFVTVDITAPLYWWKEFDTYKVGTVANSTSTMHKIESKPITMDCFETDDYQEYCILLPDFLGEEGLSADDCESMIIRFIDFLEGLRQKYLETKDKRYWKELIRWLPEAWLQTRTVTMTYENLFAMCSKGQRRFHKMNEWSGKDNNLVENFIKYVRTLPYAQEFIFLDELEQKSK